MDRSRAMQRQCCERPRMVEREKIMHGIDALEFALEGRGPSGVRHAINFAELTLAERIEFAAIRWSWWRSQGVDLAQLLPGDARTWSCLPPLPHCSELVIPKGLEPERVHKVPSHDSMTAQPDGQQARRLRDSKSDSRPCLFAMGCQQALLTAFWAHSKRWRAMRRNTPVPSCLRSQHSKSTQLVGSSA